jgi:general secretion pathway protein K
MNALPAMRASLSRRALRRRQRGAAILMAMIIVTLVVTLAAGMVWQQWRAVQVEAAERARTQSAWILGGALDWARLILREDARSEFTALSEPWAVPLAEARLSTFLAADKDNTDDAPDAFLSGAIADAQARYNLRNLIGADLKIVPAEQAALERLCQAIGVSGEVATRIAEGLRDAFAGAPTAPLLPRSIAQLTWLGVEPETARRMEPYVVLLPKPTAVNVNTAGREVLVAAVKGLDLATGERIVQVRQRTPFKKLKDFEAQIPGLGPLSEAQLAVKSNFFEVSGRLRLGDRVLQQRSLVERRGIEVIAVQREQVASREQPGGS